MRTETVVRHHPDNRRCLDADRHQFTGLHVVPPLLSADSAGVAERHGDDEGAEPGPYLIDLSFYSQFCPC